MAEPVAVRRPLGALLSHRQRMVVFAATMLCMFLTAIDQSIVATAIPHIVADLDGFNIFSWIITAYLLASTVAIPIIGKLSDMFGRKIFLLSGVGLFVLASAACGAAPTMMVLIVARGVQGIGAGLIIACVFATLGDLFTPLERAKYIAFLTGMFTFAQIAGPALGGVLADGPGWRWAFYINLPLGLLATAFIGTQLPSGGGTGGRLSDIDFRGAALLAIGTVSLLLALVWGSSTWGWGSPQTVGLLVLAAVVTVWFVMNERRHPQPIIPLALFRNVPFTQAVIMVFFCAGALFAGVQFLPTYVQTSLGGSAAVSGLVVTPQALGSLLTSIIGGQMVSRRGRFKHLLIFGAMLMVAASLILSRLHANEAEWRIAVVMVLFGFGTGLVFPITQVLAQGAVSQDEQGVASSVRQFFVLIGQTLAVAVLGIVLTTTYASAFTRDTRDIAQTMPPAVYEQFKDPTLALDHVRFEAASEQVRAVPGGEAVLARARDSQRHAVASAIDRVFLGVTLMTLIMLAFGIGTREIRLRHTFDDSEESGAPLIDLV